MNCGIAGLALAMSAIAIHRWLPLPEIESVTAKLNFFRQQPARFDTLFLGTSRVDTSVDASLFDYLVKAAGTTPTRTFNFGIRAMAPPESWFFARQILALHPPRLRTMVIELMPAHPEARGNVAGTVRAVYWRDFRHTAIALRQLWEESAQLLRERPVHWRAELWERAVILAQNLRLMTENYANLGRGTGWLEPKKTKKELRKIARELGPARDGFNPLVQQPITARDEVQFREALDRLAADDQPPPAAGFHEAQYLQLAREAAAQGVDLVLLIPPNLRKVGLFAGGSPLPCLAFDDPAAYPQLYRLENRADIFHLNARGAAEFTRVLAEAFGRLHPQKEGPR